jgi:AhpC/TSA family
MPRQGNRYAWLVGILMFMAIGVLLFTTALPNAGKGVEGPAPGTRAPAFAAPLVSGLLDFDANVCQRRSECNEQAGRVPACEVHSAKVFNVCEARRRPLVLSFVFDKGADCNPQVDRVERMKGAFPRVNFAVVFFSKKDITDVAEIVRRRGWTMPVAHDHDGGVSNLYGVGGCPTTVFTRRGGRVLKTVLGPISEQDLRAYARRLER